MNDLFQFEVNQLGKVEIAPEVIQIIAGIAATQVDGVWGLSGGVVEDLSQWLGRKAPKRSIRVDVDNPLAIELAITVKYGFHIPDVGRNVQEQVKAAVESMTGLGVDKVTVRIDAIKLPQENAPVESEAKRVK